MGRHLVMEPFLSTVVLGAGLIAEGANGETRASLLRAIAEGCLKVALAHGEPRARYVLSHVETRARHVDTGFIIERAKSMALGANDAEQLIVSARTSGATADGQSVSLFLVDARAAGVALRPVQMIDDRGAAEITLTNVQVPASALLGRLDGALPLIERAYDRGAAAVCCEAVGAMQAANETTLEYLKDARSVRASDRQVPGVAASHGGHGDGRGARALHVIPGRFRRRRGGSAGTGPCNLGLQGADRRGRTHRGPRRRPAAWRDRHDHGICDRPLPPAHRRRREAVRRRRSSPRPVCGQFVGVTSHISISVHLIDQNKTLSMQFLPDHAIAHRIPKIRPLA